MTRPLRVLVTVSPLPGHVRAMVPLCWAFRAAGHEVLLAGLSHVAPDITASGLPVLDPGGDVQVDSILEELAAEAGANPLRTLIRLNTRLAAELVDGVLDVVRADRPDVLVHSSFEMAGPLLAGMLDVPAVLLPHGLPIRANVAAGIRRGIASLRERYGLPDQTRKPVVQLDMCPPGLHRAGQHADAAAAQPRTPMRYLPYHASCTVPQWLRQPPVGQRICVTAHAEQPEPELVDELLEWARAIATPDREILVPVPAERLTADVPSAVRLVPWAPLQLLAPSCAAVVHRADPTALLTVADVAVPQLLLPQTGEETRHAAALVATGAGRTLSADCAAAELGAALDAVLTGAVRRSAQQLADEMRAMPTPAAVVDGIAAMVTRNR